MGIESKRDNSQYLVYFQEFPGVFFNSKSGGTIQRTVTQRQQAGPNFGGPVNVAGPTSVGQITVTKDYDDFRDKALELWALGWANGVQLELTLVVQPMSASGVPSGKQDRYEGCALVEFNKPDVDRQGGSVAELSLTVQPRRMI